MRRQSRRLPCSPAAETPLDDDDLLPEILLRIPPQPSSLPRASAVSKRWRSLASDPGFLRRYRIHHRRNPALLGFFAGKLDFVPTMDPPDRVPDGRFSLQLDRGDDGSPWLRILGCRHGLVLVFLPQKLQVLVWDPVTGDQHPIAIPPGFAPSDSEDLGITIHGAVLRTDGDVQHFQVVMVGTVDQAHNGRVVAQVYSSDTGIWGGLISTPLADTINTQVAGILVGNSIYWLLSERLLEFDLDRQRLAVMDAPPDSLGCHFAIMRADGGGLGCLIVLEFSAQLWKRNTDCDGADSWVLGRTIELDKLLSMDPEKMRRPPRIQGFAEDNSVVLLWTDIGLFTIQLESLQFKELFKTNCIRRYYAFESVYTAGTIIGGGHDGAELLHET